MTRPLSIRLLALVGAALFLFNGTGEVLGAHACPHHGHASVPSGVAGHAGHAGGGHAAHAGPATAGGHPVAAAPSADGAAPAGDTGPCTCAGPCHESAPKLSAAVPAPRATERPPVRRTVAYVGARHPRLFFLPFFHPYANAPPSAARARAR